jgi:hypothetical protein
MSFILRISLNIRAMYRVAQKSLNNRGSILNVKGLLRHSVYKYLICSYSMVL